MKTTKLKLFPLYLLVFLAFLGYSMMVTVFTPMILYSTEGTLNERLIWLGILLALYCAGQIFGTPLILRLAIKWGTKPVYLLSLAITAVGYASIAFSIDNHHLLALALSIFLTGFSESNVSMADQTVIGSAVNIRRTRWISYIEASKSYAFLFGPFLGGIFSKIKVSLPFWIISFSLLISLAWLVHILPNTEPKKLQYTFFKTMRKFSIRPFLFNFLAYFAFYGFFRAYPMHLVDLFHLDVVDLSHYIMWVAAAMILATSLLNRYFQRFFSVKRLAIMGTFTCGFSMLFLPFIAAPGLLMLADLFLVGLGIGVCLLNAPLLISRGLSRNERAQVIEADQTFQISAEVISSVIGGVAAILFIQLPLIFFAISGVIASLLLIRIPQYRALS